MSITITDVTLEWNTYSDETTNGKAIISLSDQTGRMVDLSWDWDTSGVYCAVAGDSVDAWLHADDRAWLEQVFGKNSPALQAAINEIIAAVRDHYWREPDER